MLLRHELFRARILLVHGRIRRCHKEKDRRSASLTTRQRRVHRRTLSAGYLPAPPMSTQIWPRACDLIPAECLTLGMVRVSPRQLAFLTEQASPTILFWM